MDWYRAEVATQVSTMNCTGAPDRRRSATPDDDVLDFTASDPDEIPWGDVAFPHIPDVISAWRGRQQDA